MPTRLLYEKICVSETLALLTAEEERFFYRLMVKCDDHGRFYASPAILLGHLFSLQLDSITPEMAREWRDRLADVGLIQVYESGGREYLSYTTWPGYQRQRGNKPKFPAPPEDSNAIEDTDGLLESIDSPQSAADCGESPQVAARASSRPGTYSGDLLRGLTPGTLPSAEGGAGGAAVAADGADAPPKPKRAKPREAKPRTDPPETLEPNDADYARGELHGMTPDEVDSKAATMLDYHRREGKDSADWHASLRTWLDNAPKYDQPRAPSSHRNGSSRPPPNGQSALQSRDASKYFETRGGTLPRR